MPRSACRSFVAGNMATPPSSLSSKQSKQQEVVSSKKREQHGEVSDKERCGARSSEKQGVVNSKEW